MKQNRVLVLYYHRINILEMDHNLLCVSPIKFRQQMLYLKHNYQLARFEDDWSLLDSDAVVVTFDDGYFDNLEYALPILEEVEVPATIFVSTGIMGQDKEWWWDELERLLLVGDNFPPQFKLRDEQFGCQWDTSTFEYRKNCCLGIHYLMKNYSSFQKREDWLLQLWKWRGLERSARESHRTLSSNDCRELEKSKMVSIGAHTVSHVSLASLSKENQEIEIKNSIVTLSHILDKKITLLSYPFGSPEEDFNEDTIEICRRYGIQKAASTENALWKPTTNLYRIPRKVVRDWGVGEFERKMKEYWTE